MKTILISLLMCITLLSCKRTKNEILYKSQEKQTYVKLCIKNNKISEEWRHVLTSRMSKNYLDSLELVEKQLTTQENDWLELISTKANYWNTIKDSLKVPFSNTYINDTTYVFLGYQGNDDAFTFKYQTVCLDLTALQRAYGSAKDSINSNRIDRIFAHEYTHIIHKEWARQNELKLKTFRDSILWECLYEGIGMYRSMSTKWRPIGDSLSKKSSKTFETLYPIFKDRLAVIETEKTLSSSQKKKLHKNLSRGSMAQKWGALPVGVWLAIEANGNDKNLIPWINKGPDGVIQLAEKYLTNKKSNITKD